MNAADRIAKAVKDRGVPRGDRGPDDEQALIELRSADIREACASVQDPDQIVQDLAMGTHADQRPNEWVAIQVDDAYHLAEKAGARADAPVRAAHVFRNALPPNLDAP